MVVEPQNLMVIKLVQVQRGGIAPVHVKPTASDFIMNSAWWIKQHLRIKSFNGHSENAVKTERFGLQNPI